MFPKQERFNTSDDTDYSDIPEALYKKHHEQYIKNAIKLLEKEYRTILPKKEIA